MAWYEPEYGGVHNVWVAGDTLYMGAYNAGFTAFDISGELRGDLRRRAGRWRSSIRPTRRASCPNAPMTWGVVVKNGLAYVNDFNNGLFIVRLEPRREISRRRCHEARARGRGGARPRGRRRARAQEPPAHDYYAWVASEAVDKLQLVRFGPAGLTIERTHTVGILPTDPDGPHGVALAPDGNTCSSPPATARRSARSGSTRPGTTGWRAGSSSACSPRRCRSRPTATSPTS